MGIHLCRYHDAEIRDITTSTPKLGWANGNISTFGGLSGKREAEATVWLFGRMCGRDFVLIGLICRGSVLNESVLHEHP